MSHLHVNGISLHVSHLATPDPAGPGEPRVAVLIHGMAGDSMASWYLTMAAPLAEAGFRVLLYDLRGHGHSDRPPRGYAFDDFVDDLEALIAQWDIAGRVYLIGNSFGGTVAFGYAVRHPDRVAAIVAIDSAPPVAGWFQRIGRRLDSVAAAKPGTESSNGTKTSNGTQLRSGAGLDAQWQRRLHDVRQLLEDTSLGDELPNSRLPDPAAFAEIDCPVLCLYGGGSPMRDFAEPTRQLLPQTDVVVVPGATHWMLIDHRSEVQNHILPWLPALALLPKSSTERDQHG